MDADVLVLYYQGISSNNTDQNLIIIPHGVPSHWRVNFGTDSPPSYTGMTHPNNERCCTRVGIIWPNNIHNTLWHEKTAANKPLLSEQKSSTYICIYHMNINIKLTLVMSWLNFFWAYIIYSHYTSFFNNDMSKVTEIHSQGRQHHAHCTQSIPWLLMTWQCKEPGHQQPCCWPSLPTILQSQHQKG